MLQVVRVTDPSNLNMIEDVIHDRWFDVEEVTYDDVTKCLRVPFKPEWLLEISDVDSYELRESEGVGEYDVNRLVYSERDHELAVTTGVPLVFRMKVSALDVSLSELVSD